MREYNYEISEKKASRFHLSKSLDSVKNRGESSTSRLEVTILFGTHLEKLIGIWAKEDVFLFISLLEYSLIDFHKA